MGTSSYQSQDQLVVLAKTRCWPNEFTKTLDWPRYHVYRHEIDEKARTLLLGSSDVVRSKNG